MSTAATTRRYTPQEYLALERPALEKHEYLDGVITAMPGASREHNLICHNLGVALGVQLRDRPCEVYPAEMRVRVTPTGLYTYPDLIVVCDEPEFEDQEFDVLLNPTAIIEVLSPSTEFYDRGAKFGHYRRLDSLRDYLLVAQNRRHVERSSRQGDDWIPTSFDGPDDLIELTSIACTLAMRDIYAKVRFPGEAR